MASILMGVWRSGDCSYCPNEKTAMVRLSAAHKKGEVKKLLDGILFALDMCPLNGSFGYLKLALISGRMSDFASLSFG